MLSGLRVVELASERAAYGAKLLGDLGADVVVVEPPGGHATRSYGPFVDGSSGDPERSLWWWHYNTSKRSVVCDLDTSSGRKRLVSLIAVADIVVEAEEPGRLAALGIDYDDLAAANPRLVWVSVSAFGRRCDDLDAPMTDLTLLAGAGPVWNCGYDDHTLPPVRGGGNQSLHIAGVWAAVGALSAVLERSQSGRGQLVDVSMHAAANVTTESGSYQYLSVGTTVQRQTGRHALDTPSLPTQIQASDGRWITTGFPPTSARDFAAVLDWLDDLGLRDEFPETVFLELAVERGGVDYHQVRSDVEVAAIYSAGREALNFIAQSMPAYDFFIAAQERDFQCGVVYAPEEAFEDEHFVARGFPVSLDQPQLGHEVRYPGAPFRPIGGGWAIRRPAPTVGEHDGGGGWWPAPPPTPAVG